MRSLIPDTVASRTLLVMVLGLLVSHAFSVGFYVYERGSTLNLVGGEHISERMFTVAQIVTHASIVARKEIVALADQDGLHVTMTRSPTTGAGKGSWQEIALRAAFARHLGRHGDRDFQFRYGDAPAAGAGRDDAGTIRLIELSLPIDNGDWLNFTATVDQTKSIWSYRFVLSMLVMTAAIIGFSAIIIRHMNVPLRRFAQAAQRLGTNIDAPPIPIVGPREVRQVAVAFNDMQQRIRRLLEDRREILSAVSHDLRTPITLLRLRAERIKNEDDKEKMLTTLREMESMVGSILSFARADAVDEGVRPVDLAALLRAICDDMADLGRPVTFAGPEKFIYDCRPSSLKRALVNIIENALKYGRCANVSMGVKQDCVSIEVDDEGPGILEAEIERVFSPFYRVERSRSLETGGVGLGLSVARSIVAVHGGSVALANRQQGGLRATVRLPMLPATEV